MSDQNVPLLRPDIFDDLDGLEAAFSTRKGGVSDPPFDTLNVGMSTGDASENIQENRKRLANTLGFPADKLTLAGQVHGDDLKAVVSQGLYKGYDALVTRKRGLLLAITAADCAAVLLADPDSGIIAACHGGWRGTADRIANKTVKAMARAGAKPERMRAYISPCIGVEEFEVGEEVASEFNRDFVERRNEWDKPHVDIKKALKVQLEQAGVPDSHIEVSPHSTAAETDRFFSHRASGGETGRMMGVIGLMPE